MNYEPRTREQMVASRWQYRIGTAMGSALTAIFLILGARANSSQIEGVFEAHDSNWVDALGPMILWIIAAIFGLLTFFLWHECRACTTSIRKKDEREIRKMRELSHIIGEPAA